MLFILIYIVKVSFIFGESNNSRMISVDSVDDELYSFIYILNLNKIMEGIEATYKPLAIDEKAFLFFPNSTSFQM